jgi:hypothetical protein
LNNGHGERWSDDFVAYLKTQGSVDIESFTNSEEERSYAIAYKKGHASYPHFSEEVGYNKDDVAAAYTAAEKAWDQGTMTSPLVGPAQSWNSLEWSATQIEAPGYDSVSVDVWGVNQYGEKQLLFARATAATLDLSNVDAQQFPYLQLTLNNKDESNATPAQLDFWRVYGELNIDGALTVEDDYSVEFDAATNQQNVVIDLAVWNMGAALMDSSEVEFIVLGGSDTLNREVAAMNASDSTNIQINIPMLGLIGQHIIVAKLKAQNSESTLSNNWGWVEVNVPNTPVASPDVIGKEELPDVVIGKLNNYPNPFSTQTRIEFELNVNSFDEMPEEVSIELYDTRGALIKKTIQPAQELNTWTWNGENQESLSMPSGMYFCRVLPIYESQKDNDQAQQKIIKIILTR